MRSATDKLFENRVIEIRLFLILAGMIGHFGEIGFAGHTAVALNEGFVVESDKVAAFNDVVLIRIGFGLGGCSGLF